MDCTVSAQDCVCLPVSCKQHAVHLNRDLRVCVCLHQVFVCVCRKHTDLTTTALHSSTSPLFYSSRSAAGEWIRSKKPAAYVSIALLYILEADLPQPLTSDPQKANAQTNGFCAFGGRGVHFLYSDPEWADTGLVLHNVTVSVTQQFRNLFSGNPLWWGLSVNCEKSLSSPFWASLPHHLISSSTGEPVVSTRYTFHARVINIHKQTK